MNETCLEFLEAMVRNENIVQEATVLCRGKSDCTLPSCWCTLVLLNISSNSHIRIKYLIEIN